ncbi:MAG TPA: hypothetical protein VE133_03470, partial [Candidatus Sulfotelmatobacter sp.]|nr:hypothetical protein [Candidatus Sulfotelmatobacter sp.]
WADECARCGQEVCICKRRPYVHKTLTQTLQEVEASISDEDLRGAGLTRDEWEQIRQWPGDGNGN